MKSVAEIIDLHGGLAALRAKAIRVEPPGAGLMRLCVERVGFGPNGAPLVSVAHYYEQNGDLLADPEMTFEVIDDDGPDGWRAGRSSPVTFEMPGMGIYREATFARDGRVYVNERERADQAAFARTWSRNIREQGFVAAYRRQKVDAKNRD
jgi:hypothetical protein